MLTFVAGLLVLTWYGLTAHLSGLGKSRWTAALFVLAALLVLYADLHRVWRYMDIAGRANLQLV